MRAITGASEQPIIAIPRAQPAPPQPQEGRRPRQHLLLVARRRPVGRPAAPVGRALGQPVEGRMGAGVLDHPRQVARIVGGEPELRARDHQLGQPVEGLALHEAALVMAGLGPRIGEQHEGAASERSGSAAITSRASSVNSRMLPTPRALDMRQALGDAVEVGLAADQADIGMLLGLPDQMLARAEADLQPHAIGRQAAAEQLARDRSSCGSAGRASARRGSSVSSSDCCPTRSFLPRRRPCSVRRRASSMESRLTSPRRSGTGPCCDMA